mgnify:CR=1 FL=1
MKFVCPVCGYVEEFDGDQLPEDFKCPPVRRSRFSFPEAGGGPARVAAEHVVGVAKMEASLRTSLPTCAPTLRASAPRSV